MVNRWSSLYLPCSYCSKSRNSWSDRSIWRSWGRQKSRWRYRICFRCVECFFKFSTRPRKTFSEFRFNTNNEKQYHDFVRPSCTLAEFIFFLRVQEPHHIPQRRSVSKFWKASTRQFLQQLHSKRWIQLAGEFKWFDIRWFSKQYLHWPWSFYAWQNWNYKISADKAVYTIWNWRISNSCPLSDCRAWSMLYEVFNKRRSRCTWRENR